MLDRKGRERWSGELKGGDSRAREEASFFTASFLNRFSSLQKSHREEGGSSTGGHPLARMALQGVLELEAGAELGAQALRLRSEPFAELVELSD